MTAEPAEAWSADIPFGMLLRQISDWTRLHGRLPDPKRDDARLPEKRFGAWLIERQAEYREWALELDHKIALDRVLGVRWRTGVYPRDITRK